MERLESSGMRGSDIESECWHNLQELDHDEGSSDDNLDLSGVEVGIRIS